MKKQVIVYKDTSEDSEIKYICGFDAYQVSDIPINLYHKIKKLLGLKFKAKETESFVATYSIKNGVITYLNRK